ncbi:MAG: 16S rRNA (guanine(966)-N(2))-methyltransferase RsmD [Bacteroidetes bacterium]|nr:16S rRNA (guanine(966)-N(2))-methyltransferase RsmD [Bacteroidota bacterium]
MRIIAGIYKGRTVKFPKSKLVRPTTDRNKEAIFNYLTNKIDFDDILACDIYAGSGSLGLEMLSRGAGEVHFVENSFQVSQVLKENIKSLAAVNKTNLFKMDAVKFTRDSPPRQYDLIIADPPFFKDDIYIVVKQIIENKFLSPQGILIVERSIQTKRNDINEFDAEPIKKLGDSLIYQFINE